LIFKGPAISSIFFDIALFTTIFHSTSYHKHNLLKCFFYKNEKHRLIGCWSGFNFIFRKWNIFTESNLQIEFFFLDLTGFNLNICDWDDVKCIFSAEQKHVWGYISQDGLFLSFIFWQNAAMCMSQFIRKN